MQENPYFIPKTLDSPMRIMLWTVDEFVVMILPFLLFFFKYNRPILSVIVPLCCWMIVKKLKKGKTSRFVLALLYWYFPFYQFYKTIPASHTRKYVG